jgi:hypothetical protein
MTLASFKSYFAAISYTLLGEYSREFRRCRLVSARAEFSYCRWQMDDDARRALNHRSI